MSPEWNQTLLQPITAEAPCGESLEDTQLLASFDAFRVFGQSTPLDPAPPWGEIKNHALEALGKSKDLRVLAFLGSAVLRTDGFPAFSNTLNVAAKWLEMYWIQVHPVVSEDAILRRNALNCFADSMGVVDGLRRIPLVTSRVHGTVSLRDVDIASGQVVPKEGEPRPRGPDQRGVRGHAGRGTGRPARQRPSPAIAASRASTRTCATRRDRRRRRNSMACRRNW